MPNRLRGFGLSSKISKSPMKTREIPIEDSSLKPIAEKVAAGERLGFDDGVALYQSQSVSLTVASHFQSSAVFDVCLYETTDVSLLSSLSPANR